MYKHVVCVYNLHTCKNIYETLRIYLFRSAENRFIFFLGCKGLHCWVSQLHGSSWVWIRVASDSFEKGKGWILTFGLVWRAVGWKRLKEWTALYRFARLQEGWTYVKKQFYTLGLFNNTTGVLPRGTATTLNQQCAKPKIWEPNFVKF